MIIQKISLGLAASAAALVLAPVANAATVIPVGSPNFFITSGTPTSSSITATFFDNFTDTTFDDIFTFTIPQNGVGSGSISTSFSSALNKLNISDLIINNVSFAVPSNGAGQSTSVNGIPILSGVLNTIEVKGSTIGSNGFSGTATFSAAAVPEPATWGMMVVGFGLMGAVMRRRSVKLRYA